MSEKHFSKGPYTRPYKRSKFELLSETHATPHNIHATPHNIYFMRLRILPRILGTLYWRVDDPLCDKLGTCLWSTNFLTGYECVELAF